MTKKSLIEGKRYEIFWIDTYNFIGWHFDDDIDGKSIEKEFQSTLGYFAKEVKDWYIFAMHKNPNFEMGFPQWGNITYVPKTSIVRVKPL